MALETHAPPVGGVSAPVSDSAEPAVQEPKVAEEFASRSSWLAAAGKFAEESFDMDGIGRVLLSEISGQARAEILGTMASSLQADPTTGAKGKLDTAAYQRALILAGVVDPTSPAGARKPLFMVGDMDAVMKVGGAKIQAACEIIERLSKMGRWQADAEGNSAATQKDGGTSA